MLVNIAASLVVWFVVIVSLTRVLCNAGLTENKKGNKLLGWVLRKKGEYTPYEPNWKDYLCVAGAALTVRIAVYIISAIAMRCYLDDGTPVDFSCFLNEWLKWDANNYVRIATLGYGGYTEELNGETLYTTLAFFPLYAWMIKLVNLVISNVNLAALVASTACFIGGSCYFYGAIAMDYGKNIAKKSLAFLTVFPFGLFYGAMMPESAFFLTVSACFYYTRKHKWAAAGIAGALAGLSRMQGIILIAVTGAEWLEYYKPITMIKEKKIKELVINIFTKAIWIPFMLVGVLIYLGINYHITGDPFKFMEYQSVVWGNGAQYFGKTVSEVWNRAFTNELTGVTRFTAGIAALAFFVMAVVLLVYGLRRIHNRYILFLVFYVIMNYMQVWLISSGRYMSVAFPMFLILGEFSEKHKNIGTLLLMISAMLFGVILYAFLTWKQIL